MSFLTLMRDDVKAGLDMMPPSYREKHSVWIMSQQTPNGGFANRSGKPDLYYTAFALRSLSALGSLSAPVATAAANFLQSLMEGSDASLKRQPHGCFCDAVAMGSWWNSKTLCEEVIGDWFTKEEIERAKNLTQTRLTALRRDDGGWAKTDRDGCGSLYHAFLASSVFADMGLDKMPGPWNAKLFLNSLAQKDGGFLENRYSRKPGTNGTAAGVALCVLLGIAMNTDPHAEFIKGMNSGEGGFFATPAAPIADLLSTYTALYALRLLSKLERRYVLSARKYARDREMQNGGYTGFALEQIVDCEYTFYGLGVESICVQELQTAM